MAALGEMLNMIAGIVMVDVFGEDACWEITTPIVTLFPTSELAAARDKATCKLDLVAEEEHHIGVNFYIDVK